MLCCSILKIVNKMGNLGRSILNKKPNGTMRLIFTTFVGIIFGFLIGVSVTVTLTKIDLSANFNQSVDKNLANFDQSVDKNLTNFDGNSTSTNQTADTFKIQVPSNPKGTENLPPGIIVAETDYYLHRLWGNPSEDLKIKPKYLIAFTVGYNQRHNVDAAVKKFSENFTIVLFHYDGHTSEWNNFEWSKRAIHISAPKQTKWWYAKRFLHPDIVAAYEYIFIWDEDLGVEHFDAEEYVKLIKKHGLEISQPGLDSKNREPTWQISKRLEDREVHTTLTEDKWKACKDLYSPPCAAFVEIMAPVFSRKAWSCVWHMIQNDLIHGWGLDFALRKCVEKPAHEKIGVVDAQWIVHQSVPSLGNQGESSDGKAPWKGVRNRCMKEWQMFLKRLQDAEIAHKSSPAPPISQTL